jgi:hypothetical protein
MNLPATQIHARGILWLLRGPIILNNHAIMLVPFEQPYGDITLFIGD